MLPWSAPLLLEPDRCEGATLETASPRAWTQLTWTSPVDRVELLEAVLGESGALAITNEEADGTAWIETVPGATPPWTRVRVRALFAVGVDVAELEDALSRLVGADIAATAEVERVEDRDWVREWMQHARPLRFGKRLWVCPTSVSLPEARDDDVTVKLDPGLGFGTGTHESTALCLEWLESRSLQARRVVDYGCGSGILGVAALRLGAADVRACDIDPQALQATRENAQRNGVDGRLWVGLPGDMSSQGADVVLANIMAETLCQLAQTLASLQAHGGELVLSGLLDRQAAAVQNVFSTWYDTDVWGRRGDWVLIRGRRLHEQPAS